MSACRLAETAGMKKGAHARTTAIVIAKDATGTKMPVIREGGPPMNSA